MVKKIGVVVVAVVCFLVLKSCFTPEVSGKNITDGYTGGPAVVNFHPECPECGHVSVMRSLNLSSGEEWEGTFICDSCGEIFDISVKRK